MAKIMAQCLRLSLLLILAAALVQTATVKADNKKESQPLPAAVVEQTSTESPIADMALIEDAPVVPKMPTEKPPVAPASNATEPATEEKSAQPHTVADFIIHPLIAFKPRQASLDELQAQGKQASNTGGSSPATPGTWLFGSPGQALGSSFSTLAGSVSGWFNDRLAAAGQQLPGLPGLVDTPVRDGASTSTTSTTTQRPDIVVRLQQRPNRRRGNNNLNNGIRNGNRQGNGNGNGNRLQRPNRFNNHVDSLESLEEYDDVDYFNGNQYDEEFYDDEQDVDDVLPHNDDDDLSVEHVEHDDDEEQQQQSTEPEPQQEQQKPKQKLKQQQQQRRRPVQRRKQQTLAAASPSASQSQRRQQQVVRRGQPLALLEQAEEEQEEEVEDDDDAEVENDDEDDEETYHNVIYTQSSRKSPSQTGFIQNGQQSLINQIRRFTFGQTPAELGTKLRKTPSSQSSPSRGSGSSVRRPQQTTLLVNRNGQTVYVAPELLHLAPGYTNYGYVPTSTKKQSQQYHQRLPASPYPQPPLTVPLRRKGRPTQYITIPWSQLGLSSPDRQSVVSLGEGIQAQPLILNIPESAISTVPVRGGSSQNGIKKKKRPTLTAAAVPLLADASLMDIFQPPQIPPSRTGSNSNKSKPVLIAAKPVQAGNNAGLLPTRIRPGTIVEKAPAMDSTMDSQAQKEQKDKDMTESSPAVAAEQQQQQQMQQQMQMQDASPQMMNEQEQFIIVGEDNEPGLSRHVQPAYGDARYVSYGDFQPYFDMLHQNRRFALRKVGRALEEDSAAAIDSN